MSGAEIVREVATSIFGGGLVAVSSIVFMWRRQAPKVKAQTAKIAAETTETGVRTQGELIEQIASLAKQLNDQGKELGAQRDTITEQGVTIKKLHATVAEQGEQIAALQTRNHNLAAAMRAAVAELLAWIQRALSVMTPDQQETVGPAPDYKHLTNPDTKETA